MLSSRTAQDKVANAVAKKQSFLSLARCGLTDAAAEKIDFSTLSTVIVLDLSGNPLTRLPAGLTLMPQLEVLTAYKCQIEEQPSGVLLYLRNLPGQIPNGKRQWNILHGDQWKNLINGSGFGRPSAPQVMRLLAKQCLRLISLALRIEQRNQSATD